MTKTRLFIAVAALFAIASAGVNSVAAQGVTTGAIAGQITDQSGAGVANAQVQITNRSTGFSTGGLTRESGSFVVQGLEVGGPYTITVRRIGYVPQTRENIQVGLSATTRLDLKLAQQATQLSGVTVNAIATTSDITPSNMGTKTSLSDTVIQRLPTQTRNLTDFIKLTPQVSASGPGFSGGGMSNRMNNVQIDGATERDVFGLGSTGQPGGQISAKAISIEAVKEFQVLLAPFDVRQGNFGGLLLNAVTRSGTNTWHGSAFRYYRNQDYGRNVPALRATPFERDQFGFSLGGPIIKDKLHFFTANEWQRESTPVTGPYVGQSADIKPIFPFSDAEIARFEAAFAARGGGASPGTAGSAVNVSPMDNIFARLDYQINDVHRIVARFNYTDAFTDNRRQVSRTATQAVYSSNFHSINSNKKAPVIQIFSNFKNGWNNEAIFGAALVQDRRNPKLVFPQITVNYSGNRKINVGSDQFSQGNQLDANTYEFTDNLTIPRGNHNLVFGTRNELVKIRNLFTRNSYGSWTFASIDDFEAGKASALDKAFILSQGGNVYFDALQTALYAQDQWTATPRFTFTAGIRADISRFLKDNTYALAIDTAYGRHETAKGALQFSPRVGFNWDATGDQVNQIRGGIGLFVGVPPYVWMENAYIGNGKILSTLSCGDGRFGSDPSPTFRVDASTIQTCANGAGSKPIGEVNFLDKNLKFPQPLRTTVAYDRVLGDNVVMTFEGLYSKTLNQFFFVNLNLAGPQGVDKFGRVLYGTHNATGQSTPTLPAAVIANGGKARFGSAINILNQNKDYAYSLTGQLRKRYRDNWEALIAYTYGRAYDVQSFTSSTHTSNWSFGRTLSTAQEVPNATVSLFDQPHKIVGFYTRTFNWDGAGKMGRWAQNLATDLTISYQGVSGSPHDYVYGGFSGRGDLNADGIQGNDLIYVPKDVNNPAEIVFAPLTVSGVVRTPAQQAQAFDALINSTRCLRDSRGTILARNSCRLPFSNTWDITLRQNIPTIAQQRLALTLDIFNFGNMMNKNWGKQRVNVLSGFNNISLLTQTSATSADPATRVPVVTYNYTTFDPVGSGQPQPYQQGNFVSNFWRMQIAARYSF